MSKTAIFSDIHGNIHALNAVLDDARAQGIQNFACLGDIVGYGPNPIDCIATIQKIGCVCVKGNHDDDSSNLRELNNLNNQARVSLEWTRKVLSESQKAWLRNLPYQRRLGRNMLTHSSLENSTDWPYIRNRFDAEIDMARQKVPITFFGHTHIPVSYCKNPDGVATINSGFNIDPDNKYLVNVGSVGQPRDGIAEACYIIFDRIDRKIDYRRVRYDIDQVIQEIHNSGLPETLAQRLIEAA